MQQPQKKRLFIVEVPQPEAWALSVGNANVLNLGVAPREEVVGHYLALCAGGGYCALPRGWRVHMPEAPVEERLRAAWAPPPPEDEDIHYNAVVAVAQVLAVGPPAPGVDGRWYTGPVGVWLDEPVRLLRPVPCTAEEEVRPLPEALLPVVRHRFRLSRAVRHGQLPMTLEALLALPEEEQERVVQESLKQMRGLYPDSYRRLCQQMAGGAPAEE